jgi:hypothetical protein
MCVFSDGHKYEGDWVRGAMSGRGTVTWQNGSKYVGNFVNNIRSGSGVCTFANGDVYSGQLKKCMFRFVVNLCGL